MRIISGKHRSRKLNTLDGTNTRPTQDKIKEAIFSSVGTYFNGGNMLDLFAGSGSVGLECISRGIDHAYFCDCNKDAIKIIQENIELLNEKEHTNVLYKDYKNGLQYCKDMKFNFIFIDPPYALKVFEECLVYIDSNNMLEDYGTIVIESSKEDVFLEQYGKLVKKKEKTYGITRVTYYVKEYR